MLISKKRFGYVTESSGFVVVVGFFCSLPWTRSFVLFCQKRNKQFTFRMFFKGHIFNVTLEIHIE